LKDMPSGMPSSLFAPNVPSAVQPPSAIGIGPKTDAMLGNRPDADEGSLNKLDTTQRLHGHASFLFYAVGNSRIRWLSPNSCHR
jgi:hypothetical protein